MMSTVVEWGLSVLPVQHRVRPQVVNFVRETPLASARPRRGQLQLYIGSRAR